MTTLCEHGRQVTGTAKTIREIAEYLERLERRIGNKKVAANLNVSSRFLFDLSQEYEVFMPIADDWAVIKPLIPDAAAQAAMADIHATALAIQAAQQPATPPADGSTPPADGSTSGSDGSAPASA